MSAPLLGFDTNNKLTSHDASAFYAKGYRFVMRYLTRTIPHPGDLDAAEIQIIRGAGLGLGCVQHVESAESWMPSAAKGMAYGVAASQQAHAVGYPAEYSVACDLEGVSIQATHDDIIGYCNAWQRAVASAGFKPCLYVGWHCGLNAADLYNRLLFNSYWAAYNLDADEYPIVRGIQMKQRSRTLSDKPQGSNVEFDVNTVYPDRLGGLLRLWGVN